MPGPVLTHVSSLSTLQRVQICAASPLWRLQPESNVGLMLA